MNDDELLRGLKQAFRDEAIAREGDRSFEALAEGALPETERTELEQRAAADPTTAAKLDAYRPLGAGFEEQIAQSYLASAPGAAKPVAPAQADRAPTPADPAAAVATVHALPSRARVARIGALIATPLAMAAAVALLVRQAAKGDGAEELPTYDLTVMANAQPQRAGEPIAASGEVRLLPTAFFDAVARPAIPAKEGVGARAAIVRDGVARVWSVPLDFSPEGAVHIAGPAAALFPETRGTYEIVVALARPDALPDDRALFACAERKGPCQGYRLARTRIVFVE